MTTVVGSISDLILDEGRRRLYAVNASQNRVDVYSLPPSPLRLIGSVRVDDLPLSGAMSRDGRVLYVAAHNSSALNVIDLETLAVTNRASLAARPEGVAVGSDERVLITTIGTGPNNFQNTLLLYEPSSGTLANVVIAPPTPANPNLAPPSGRLFLSNRSRLETSADGQFIIGINIPNANSRAVFVYEVASGTVLRSRTVTNASQVLSVSPDGKKFMAGLTLFDSQTLEVLAQQNLANAPYPVPNGVNFNLEQNQGGSVFSPDGQFVYGAFNVSPVQNPPARANIGQLMISDSDNLLIHRGYQTPENLVGKMVVTADGGTLYAISESGFAQIPIGAAAQNPIANLSSSVVLLSSDQCGVTADQRTANVQVVNEGRGRMTASAQVLQIPNAAPGGLGGAGGPGGGPPGGGIIIILPPVIPGGAAGGQQPGLPGFGGAGGVGNAAVNQTAPQVRTTQSQEGATVAVTYNTTNNRTLGTVSPVHDYLIQSPEAINIPPRLRVFQNNRDAETKGSVMPVQVSVSANEGLADIVYDSVRNRVYIANSGMNRIDVLDARTKEWLAPIKVGQLPRSLALMPDNNTLYVANTGSENISIVDLTEGKQIGRIRMPPLPFNSAVAAITPSLVAASQQGPQILMSNGTLWKVVGNEMVPRISIPVIGSANAPTVTAPRTMASTPNGEYVLLMGGNGFVYLYDAMLDDFVIGRQIFSNPIQGYYGPVAAGPGGRYFLANGTVLNSALTPVGSAGSVIIPQGANQQTLPRPISAVVPLSTGQFVRFAQPVRAQANNPLATAPPTVEVADAVTGNAVRSVNAIEGPISTQTGTQRVNVGGRNMAVDPQGTTAYLLTTTGLSIVSLDAVTPAQRPTVNPQGGVVNSANLAPGVAPGSLVAIRGRGLGDTASTQTGQKLPTVLGGVCVTLNNQPLPLAATSDGQVTAQVPQTLAAGRYPLVVRNLTRNAASLAPVTVTVAKYAPAVVVDAQTKQAAIYHEDGKPVTKDNPTTRDERLTMFAVGLGATKTRVAAGEPAPASPLAVTDPVQVYFGDPRYRQAEVVVESSALAPGLVGVYQLELYVPGDRMRGDDLDVTVKIGGISSPVKGDLDPRIAVR